MNAERYLVDVEMDDLRIFKPPDLLDRFDRSLDGTLWGNLLPESRAETAAAYFDTLNAALKEKWREEVNKASPSRRNSLFLHGTFLESLDLCGLMM